jgi:hypothetical protein
MTDEYEKLLAEFNANLDRAMSDHRARREPVSTAWFKNKISQAEYRARVDGLVKELNDRVDELRSAFDMDMLRMIKPAGNA